MSRRTARFLIFAVLVPVMIGIIHHQVFPHESRGMFVWAYDFESDENLRYRDHVPIPVIDSLKVLIAQAEVRCEGFWGELVADPTFIYCHTEDDYALFDQSETAPASFKFKMGGRVFIGPRGLSLDIIAHELSHAEFAARLGFFTRTFNMPSWLDEGIAMQVDYRADFSEDSLRYYTDDLKQLPDLPAIGPGEFNALPWRNIQLNYATARYLVKEWHTPEKLDTLILDLVNGHPVSLDPVDSD